MRQIKNFVNGEYVDPQSGKYMPKLSPLTNKAIYELPDSNELDMVLAIKAAHTAFEKWSQTKTEDRAKILFRIAELIEENLDALAHAETEDVGKPLNLSRTMDIPRAAKNFRFFASAILNKSEKSDRYGRGVLKLCASPTRWCRGLDLALEFAALSIDLENRTGDCLWQRRRM